MFPRAAILQIKNNRKKILTSFKFFYISFIRIFQAHFHERRAENHLKRNRFDEAVEHLKKTVELLEKAMTQTTIPNNIESLTLQRDYHIKYQRRILLMKDEYHQRLALHQERLKAAERENALKKDETPADGENEPNDVTADGEENAVKPDEEERKVNVELPPLELPRFDLGSFEK